MTTKDYETKSSTDREPTPKWVNERLDILCKRKAEADMAKANFPEIVPSNGLQISKVDSTVCSTADSTTIAKADM